MPFWFPQPGSPWSNQRYEVVYINYEPIQYESYEEIPREYREQDALQFTIPTSA